MHVVVVCGNMGHGKDALCKQLGLWVEKPALRAFADPLKQAVSITLGIPLEWCYTSDGKKEIVYGKTVRHWLQHYGTEYVRTQVDKDVWVHRMADYVRAGPRAHIALDDQPWDRRLSKRPADAVFVSDGRFRNELVVLSERLVGFAKVYAVRVRRPGVSLDLSHPSESEIYAMPDSAFDYVIENDGTLDDLSDKARACLVTLGVPLVGSL